MTFQGKKIFVDATQHPVYVSSADTADHSNCDAGCLSIWPLVPAPAGTLPAPFGSFERSDNGTFQLTYRGAPLYTFVGDTQPGVPTGDGIGTFSLAKP